MIAGPLRGPGISNIDLYFMMGVSVVLLPLRRTGYRLARWEGGLLLATYGVYLFLIWPR